MFLPSECLPGGDAEASTDHRYLPGPDWRVKTKFRVAEKYSCLMLGGEPSEGLFMSTTTHSVPLLKRTQELVLNAPRSISYAEMARQIGVSAKWVSLFSKGQIPNPGIVTVQRLHDYLANISSGV